MAMQRWDPFGELRRMEDRMNRLWRSFGRGMGNEGEAMERWGIPLDVVEEGDKVIAHASLPGVKAEDIKVSIENDVLTIRAQTSQEREHREEDYLMRERRVGSFYQALRLPNSVDTDKAETSYDQGVLTITFPKLEAKKARHLEVKVGGHPKAGEGSGSKAK